MAITINDIRAKQASLLERKTTKVRRFPAKLVKVNGSVIPNNQPNKVYFSEWGNEESAVGIAYNNIVKAIAGLNVEIEQSPDSDSQFRVVGLFEKETSPLETQNLGEFATPSHHITHEYPDETTFNSDVVRIFAPAIMPFKLTASGLTYYVQPFNYVYQQAPKTFPGYSDTVTASSAGKIRYVAVGLDLTSNTITTIEGNEVIDNGVVPVPLPDLIINFILSGFLLIDDTEVTEWLDYRSNINFDGNNLVARQTNDLLISENGYSFESRKPITDRFGNIITDSDGSIVTV